MANKAKEIENLLSALSQNEGFELVDIEYVREDGKRVVRIYIDNEKGITVDDCEKMSRIFSKVLDQTDIVDESYILEISSPGLYRTLKKEKDYLRFIGKKARIQTFVAYNGQRNFLGTLMAFSDGIVKIKDETNGDFEIEYSNIRKANLEPEF